MDNFLPLYQAFDALFPIGGYTLSNGMETYTQCGLVRDKPTLRAYLDAQVYLLPYGDLGIAAYAAQSADFSLLDNLCAAMKQPLEIRHGSEKLCARFLKAQEKLADYPSLSAYRTAISDEHCDGHYPVAVGLFVRDLGVDLCKALSLYCYNILSATVNHAVKLIPLRQMDGQSVLFEVMPSIHGAAERASAAELDELGVTGCGFDLRAMQHETLPGRLYIS
ncbi:urease accessory protein UreF [Clostridia bacterium]|nr:urease accessory protein UreF [Clostridia bacterium]